MQIDINKNVWFVNFYGIGNGVMIAPILRCFEKSYPSLNYYHTENQFLFNTFFKKQAGLKNLKGFSPAIWRRFKEEDWKLIKLFIKEKKIGLIVNLRNEGPRYDIGYYKFKEFLLKKKMNINFWDLDFDVIEHRKIHQSLTCDILDLFRKHYIDVSNYNSKWLESICKYKNNIKNIGFGMAASQINKRWPINKWIELANIIIKKLDRNIIIFSGISEKEKGEAMAVLRNINKKKCKVIYGKSIQNLALEISKLLCFISNDTGLLHIAAAMDVPTIGLYISTNSEIWSPYDKTNFIACQNSFIKKCPNFKYYCGNCLHYYDVCPAIMQYGDDINPNAIYKIICHLIGKFI
jgi:ADP-heptose:LPS heptosyltransferase